MQRFVQGLRSRFGAVDRAAFVADEDARLIADRLLHLACEACIDIGNHVRASSGGPQPESYRETFALLAKQGLIPEALAAALQRMAVMRDILVHGYLAVDPAKAHEVVTQRLGDLEQFAALMARLG